MELEINKITWNKFYFLSFFKIKNWERFKISSERSYDGKHNNLNNKIKFLKYSCFTNKSSQQEYTSTLCHCILI